MNSLNNISTIDMILKMDRIKKIVLPAERINWSDLTILCGLKQLKEQQTHVTPADLIDYLKMNKCWVYKSLRKLHANKLIHVTDRPQEAALISVGGWGVVLIQRLQECFERDLSSLDEPYVSLRD